MTFTLLVVLCAFITIVAAARSTWSPCGLSMLSTITPLGERSRGHRYPVTVAWFVLGAFLGGLTLGALMIGPAALVDVWDPSAPTLAWVVVIVAAVTVAADLRIGGFALPSHPRQVNEVWLGRYRHWVYGVGFGWQIGVGVATYIMTSAVFLMIALAGLTGEPLWALAFGAGFGLIRGLAVLLGRKLTTPQAMRTFHRQLEAAAPWSLLVAAFAQIVVLGLAVSSVSAPLVGVVVAAAGTALAVRRLLSDRDRLGPFLDDEGVRTRWPRTT